MNRMLENFTAQGELVGYFGYGSLVNRLTLTTRVVAAFPVRLKGWRRTWRPRPDMGAEVAGGLSPSLLTAHRAPESAIDGLLVIDGTESRGWTPDSWRDIVKPLSCRSRPGDLSGPESKNLAGPWVNDMEVEARLRGHLSAAGFCR
jgi:hypothetical protein